ncbi:putative ferric reductase [Streptomyces candidus]|uniref:Putative ferric reductase n=2 Tax=Streptomyces candidus TaxID=67283 RepID=A0A7X0HAN2_9ACTN|nr:ferredoxin reductase family protein [Streptomyces candidus]MBB6434045.1 putative ferric reductase [Streptomyces candidus]GHH33546.1 ferric reductase [Streptomyces candidus]
MTIEATPPQADAHPALAAYLSRAYVPAAAPRTAAVAGAPWGPGAVAATAGPGVPPMTRTPPAAVAVRMPSRLSPRTVRAGIVGGIGVVCVTWGVQAVPSFRLDAVFASAAHLSGLLAGYGVLVMLFLMARVPAVEHGVGADRLARWHARGGRHVLSLCAGHGLLALCGYAVHADVDLFTAAVDLLGYGGILAATAGTVLLAAAGVSSVRTVRRKVGHEAWRAVHLLTYVGAALAFAHQLVGPDVAGSPVTLWGWALLHAGVAVLLVWYRAVVPVRQALRHSLRVCEVRDEGPGVVSVLVQGIGVAELRAEPGQFFRWRFLQRRVWHTALPFSLSAPVKDDMLRITVKAAGDHTRRLRRLRAGTRVVTTGPFGAMTAHRRTRRKVLLIAGGVGITPMRALFETLPGGPGEVTLLYRARHAGQLVLRAELEEIARRTGAGLHFLLGASDSGYDPLAPRALHDLLPDIAEHDVYLCGPPGMADAAVASLRRAGVPDARIHTENFTH